VFRKRLFALLSVVLVSGLVLSACAVPQPTSPTAPVTPATPATPFAPAKPAVGGEIVWHAPSDPDHFGQFWGASSYGARVRGRVYGGGLLTSDPSGVPIPDIAEAMPTVSADNKTYTFKIRKGIKFNDGVEMTAKDVKLSYDIIMHADYDGWAKSTARALEKVEVLDDYTIRITTKEIYAPFYFQAASYAPTAFHKYASIPVGEMSKSDVWGKNPVGIGPYVLAEYRPGQHTVLERNPLYWEFDQPGVNNQLVGPYVQRIRLKVIPEQATAVAAMEAGELNYYDSFPGSDTARMLQDYGNRLAAHDWDRRGFGYMTFNNETFPTNDKALRQALNMSLNRDVIIAGLLDGRATKPAGFVPPVHWVHDSSLKGYDLDPSGAAALLAKNGYTKNAAGNLTKDGKEIKLQYVATVGNALIDGIALQAQKDWGALGIQVDLVMVDFNTLLEKHLYTGDYSVTFSGLSLGLDPASSFDLFNSEEIRINAAGVNTGANRSRYRNAEVDELLKQAKTTVDIETRKKLYRQAERIIVDDAVMLYIYVNRYTDFVSKEFKGVINAKGTGLQHWTTYWFATEK
jgi:peptide/nickel transport system substrate-binding protein